MAAQPNYKIDSFCINPFTCDFQVVTLDARNHGESEHNPMMDYLTMRDDLLGVMDILKVERPILLGHSMGGKTVMTCALTVVGLQIVFFCSWCCQFSFGYWGVNLFHVGLN